MCTDQVSFSVCFFDIFLKLILVLYFFNFRIIKYDPKTKSKTVVADGLLFPNGMAISKNEDFLVFTESAAARVMR